MTLSEIVSQLKIRGYHCINGRLESDAAFLELERLVSSESTHHYRVLRSVDTEALEKMLFSYLNADWQLQGGVSITVIKRDDGEPELMYAQAVTKKT